jgi:hypothetical protein
METVSVVWIYERTFAGPQDDDEVMEAVQSWLEATPKSLFSRGHPQVCGQVDRLCCEAGGLCRKIRHKQFL